MSSEKSNIDIEKIKKHWIDTSDEDYQTMLVLFGSKSFSWSLFLGHISVEKLLKAYYVSKNKNHAPYTHNLYRLAELSGIELTDEYADWLDEISAFNLNARYDDYKREFFSICTEEYTKEWIEKIKIIRLWIKQML
ncbi:MAG TPA: HEPN domain-containing protein [Bacteroidales bacterium]|nr:HEPN domain-containing protein [Bacteroidales bacterium]HPS27644.1 HEPN domain-containing protein [Bacteroidales bacterium]